MPNETIGSVQCPFCAGDNRPVRKNANKKLYFVCPSCGIVQPNMPGFQEWILAHAKINGAEQPPIKPPLATVVPTADGVHAEVTVPPGAAYAVVPSDAIKKAAEQSTKTEPPKKKGGFGVIRF